jgi:hypothetical protein
MKTTQRDKLFQLFESRPGQWIPLPEILQLGIAQYNARIYELRKEGKEIQNKTIEIVDGQKHTAFMYVKKEFQNTLFC